MRAWDTAAAQGGGDAEARGERVQPHLPVEIHVLAGVDQVEAAYPEQHRKSQQVCRRIHSARHGDPAAGRRHAVGKAEHGVGHPGEALRPGVADQHDDGDGRQPEGERVQHPGASTRAASPAAASSSMSRRDSSPFGMARRAVLGFSAS